MSRLRARLLRLEQAAGDLGRGKHVQIMVAELNAAGFRASAWDGEFAGITLACDYSAPREEVERRNALLADFDRRGMGHVQIVMPEVYASYSETKSDDPRHPLHIDIALLQRDPQALGAFVRSGETRLFPPRGGSEPHSNPRDD